MISITIPSRPIPYKRTTQRQKWVDEQYHKYQAYKELVQICARKAYKGETVTDDVWVSVDIYLYKGHQGDIDNYIKGALDSINKLIIQDDKQVVRVIGTKHQADSKDNECMKIVIDKY